MTTPSGATDGDGGDAAIRHSPIHAAQQDSPASDSSMQESTMAHRAIHANASVATAATSAANADADAAAAESETNIHMNDNREGSANDSNRKQYLSSASHQEAATSALPQRRQHKQQQQQQRQQGSSYEQRKQQLLGGGPSNMNAPARRNIQASTTMPAQFNSEAHQTQNRRHREHTNNDHGQHAINVQGERVSSQENAHHNHHADHTLAEEAWADFTGVLEESIAKPGRKALHDFFYPQRAGLHPSRPNRGQPGGDSPGAAPPHAPDERRSSNNVSGPQTPVDAQSAPSNQFQQMSPEPPSHTAETPTRANRRQGHMNRANGNANGHNAIGSANGRTRMNGSNHGTIQRSDSNDTAASSSSSLAHQHDKQSMTSAPANRGVPQTPLSMRSTQSTPASQPHSRQRRRHGRPKRRRRPPQRTPSQEQHERALRLQQKEDMEYVESFWTAYDEFLILSLFTQVGILCRLAAAYWFRFFDSVFRVDSALFVNLPLNCLSCFVVGLLGSGENLMEIVTTRFTPPRLQQEVQQQQMSLASIEQQEVMMEELDYWDALVDTSINNNSDGSSSGGGGSRARSGQREHRQRRHDSIGSHDSLFSPGMRRRRNKRSKARNGAQSTPNAPGRWQPPGTQQNLQIELREVQLLALERRIRMSPCLLLFPVKKEDVDVVENYTNDGQQRNSRHGPAGESSPMYASRRMESMDVESNSVVASYSSNGNGIANMISQGSALQDEADEGIALDGDGFDDLIFEEEGPMDVPSPASASMPASPSAPTLTPTSHLPTTPTSVSTHGTPANGAQTTRVLSPAEAAVASIAARDAIRKSRSENDINQDRHRQLSVNTQSDDNSGLPMNQASGDSTPNGHHQPMPMQAVTNDRLSPQPSAAGHRPTLQTQHHQTIPMNRQRSNASAGSEGQGMLHAHTTPHNTNLAYARAPGGNVIDYGQAQHTDIDILIGNIASRISKKLARMSRVSLANGWDVGTSPEEKSEDLMLGLRVGLCGALSSFSSWLSSMVQLLKAGELGKAIVGLSLGIQLPIVSYRFGQHVAVYIFIWRCRRETRRDERRGYGIRLSMDDESDFEDDNSSSYGASLDDPLPSHRTRQSRTKGRRTIHEEEDNAETPSVRAIITALFILAFVAQLTALNFFRSTDARLLALSLFFSPLGVITRWRLSKLNMWRPNFPIGTFTCNILACALSGSLGSILAGNPDPRERTVLVSVIAGFGGTLSSVARFIVEILEGNDPVLFRLDGMYYAVSSVFWGCVVSFVFRASVDWVESVGQPAAEAAAAAAAAASADGDA